MKSTFLYLMIPLLWIGCHSEPENRKGTETKEKPEKTLENSQDYYQVLADTISYGVVVKNKDTTDRWKEKWLRSLKLEKFVDQIFSKVYAGEATAYNYFDETPLTIHDIKELEKQEEFQRNRIGKIQFEEIWYYSNDQMKMEKHVYSVMLAYEVYRNDGSFRGYKPAFKIYFD